MKYPLFFRILAIVNLFIASSVFLLFRSALFFSSEAEGLGGPHGTILLGTSATWLCISFFCWVSGSRYAYTFLYINFSVLLAVSGFLVVLGMKIHTVEYNDEKVIPYFLGASIGFVYSLFSLCGLWYKPVVTWVKEEARVKWSKDNLYIVIIFLLSTLTGHLAIWYSGKSYLYMVDIPTKGSWFLYTGNGREINVKFPVNLPSNAHLYLSLHKEVEFDAIKIAVNQDPARNLLQAKVHFYEAGYKLVTFIPEGDFLVAHFPPIQTFSLSIYPISQQGSTYFIQDIVLAKYYSYASTSLSSQAIDLYEEPPADPSVVITEEAVVTEETPSKRTLTEDLLPELYLSFFKASRQTGPGRDYYFTPGTLALPGVEEGFGMYSKGLSGLRDNAIEAASNFLGYSTATPGKLDELAQIQIFFNEDAAKTNDPTFFRQVNPHAIRWGYNHLIPDPQTKIGRHTAAEVYESCFQRICRLLVLTHRHMMEELNFRREQAAYLEAMETQENFRGSEWLSERYGEILATYNDEEDEYWDQEAYTMLGFWLRRGMDASEEEVWTGLQRVMQLYDQEWYEENAPPQE